MTALAVRGLHVRLGGQDVLRGVDLDVPTGSVTAVLGPSGCGKTTLLRVVAGFQTPSHGSVRIAGKIVASATDSVLEQHVPVPDRRVGVVPQEGALFPHLDVAGNVGFGLPRGQAHRGTNRDRVEELLRLVGLPGFASRRVNELSGGQQQRVALARALAPGPRLVLLDEPFSALDASLREELRMEVAAVLRAAGATAVVVTHDRSEALSMADQVAVMELGRIRQQGTPSELYHDPVDLSVARGTGDLVVLPAVLDPADPGWASTPLGRVRLRAGTNGTGLTGAGADGQTCVLLRPEQLVPHPAVIGDDSGSVPPVANGSWPRGIVTECRFHGHDSVVLVDVAGQRIRCRSTRTWPVGASVQVEVAGPARLIPS